MKKFNPHDHKGRLKDSAVSADDVLNVIWIVAALVFLRFFGGALYWWVYALSPLVVYIGLPAILTAGILIWLNRRKKIKMH